MRGAVHRCPCWCSGGITALGSGARLGRRGIPLYVAGEPKSLWSPDRAGIACSREVLRATPRRTPCARGWKPDRRTARCCFLARTPGPRPSAGLRPDLRGAISVERGSAEVMRRLIDKGGSRRRSAELGMPHPRTVILLRDEESLATVPDRSMASGFLKPTPDSGRFRRSTTSRRCALERSQAPALVAEAAGWHSS